MSLNTLPLSKPLIGVSGSTGYWRFKKPEISGDRCVRCYLCWLYCPDSSIDIDDLGRVTVDYRYCKGCGICANICPVRAIAMVNEYGG